MQSSRDTLPSSQKFARQHNSTGDILNGRIRDLATIESALDSLLKEPAFMATPNALARVISALDYTRAEGTVLLHWWKRLTEETTVPVSVKAVRSLVAQIHSRARDDKVVLKSLVEVIVTLDDAYVIQDTVTIMLLYKIFFILGRTDTALEYYLKTSRNAPETVERGAIMLISEFGKLSKLDIVERVFETYTQTVGSVGANRTIVYNTYLQSQLLNGKEKEALE
jgi:hypothetical protein